MINELSICIPTYNRSKTLHNLVMTLLSLRRNDFDIIITDNVSTDDTEEVIKKIRDKRIKYIKNSTQLPALNNMVEALYNADGKYALYCNDRDVLFPDSVSELIDQLKKNDFSFVYTTPSSSHNTHTLHTYESSYLSLTNHKCGYHPTGMVFNMNIAKKYLRKEDYFQYLDVMNTYCFLMRDLFAFGKTAIFDNGCWGERPREYLAENKSGTVVNKKVLFFYPELKLELTKKTLLQIKTCKFYSMSKEELCNVYMYTMKYYGLSLLTYKINLMSLNMTRHYGIEKKYISFVKMDRILDEYLKKTFAFLQENCFPKEVLSEWKEEWNSLRREMFFACIKYDAKHFLLRCSGKTV